VGFVVLLAACLVPGRTLAVSPSAQGAPLEVRTSIASTVGFGDSVTARVVVLLRPAVVESDRLRVTAALEPFTQLAAPNVLSRRSRAGVDVVTYELMATCLDQRCVAPRGDRQLRLPPVRAEVPARTGSLVSVIQPWPRVTIRGRVDPSDLTRSPLPFQSDLSAPRVTYRIAASKLAAVLALIALALALTAIALASMHIVRSARRRRVVETTDLERALALARSAESRSPEDRRRALGLLARVLGSRGQRLAPATSTLAWSAPLPSPRSISTLVEQVEREVEVP
jgi:hypothetical protein